MYPNSPEPNPNLNENYPSAPGATPRALLKPSRHRRPPPQTGGLRLLERFGFIAARR
jgi:hypothetical protein